MAIPRVATRAMIKCTENGGNDFLYGGGGKDKLIGGSGNDMIDGGRGNDKIYADFGDDVIIGGSGIDWLFFNGDTAAYCDLYHGQSHNTGYGRDKVKGIENISGSKRGDTFHGTEDKNIIKGMGGNDAINGRSGNDILYGGNHNDLVNGGRGNDRIYGDKGDDRLIGGPKNDKLFGGSGRDTLTGEAGQDQLFGGSGADTFIFHGTNESNQKRAKADVIIDFEQGRDVIDLSSIDASTKIRGADTFVFNGTTKFKTEKVGEIYYQKYNNPGSNNDFTMVYVDTNDDRGAEMSIKLQGLYDLTSDDFLL